MGVVVSVHCVFWSAVEILSETTGRDYGAVLFRSDPLEHIFASSDANDGWVEVEGEIFGTGDTSHDEFRAGNEICSIDGAVEL